MYLLLFIWIFSTLTLQLSASDFSAIVTESNATFTLPVEAKKSWSWLRPETSDNQQEYRMDVTVKNEGKEYAFGFYLWKRSRSTPGSGSLNDLISRGQKSLFERSESRLMTRVSEAVVKVTARANDRIEISLSNKKDLKRLFSSRPTEVVFKIKYPDQPVVSQTTKVEYR